MMNCLEGLKMRRCHAVQVIIVIKGDHQGAFARQWIVLNVIFCFLPEQGPYCIADSVVLWTTIVAQ